MSNFAKVREQACSACRSDPVRDGTTPVLPILVNNADFTCRAESLGWAAVGACAD